MSRFFCAVAAFLLLAACAASPADEQVTEAVRASIHRHPALLADHLNIHSENGVVYISGLVSTYFEYTEVDRVAKATPGVVKVVNMTAVDDQRF